MDLHLFYFYFFKSSPQNFFPTDFQRGWEAGRGASHKRPDGASGCRRCVPLAGAQSVETATRDPRSAGQAAPLSARNVTWLLRGSLSRAVPVPVQQPHFQKMRPQTRGAPGTLLS